MSIHCRDRFLQRRCCTRHRVHHLFSRPCTLGISRCTTNCNTRRRRNTRTNRYFLTNTPRHWGSSRSSCRRRPSHCNRRQRIHCPGRLSRRYFHTCHRNRFPFSGRCMPCTCRYKLNRNNIHQRKSRSNNRCLPCMRCQCREEWMSWSIRQSRCKCPRIRCPGPTHC